jgi:hypothetical protein
MCLLNLLPNILQPGTVLLTSDFTLTYRCFKWPAACLHVHALGWPQLHALLALMACLLSQSNFTSSTNIGHLPDLLRSLECVRMLDSPIDFAFPSGRHVMNDTLVHALAMLNCVLQISVA